MQCSVGLCKVFVQFICAWLVVCVCPSSARTRVGRVPIVIFCHICLNVELNLNVQVWVCVRVGRVRVFDHWLQDRLLAVCYNICAMVLGQVARHRVDFGNGLGSCWQVLRVSCCVCFCVRSCV